MRYSIYPIPPGQVSAIEELLSKSSLYPYKGKTNDYGKYYAVLDNTYKFSIIRAEAFVAALGPTQKLNLSELRGVLGQTYSQHLENLGRALNVKVKDCVHHDGILNIYTEDLQCISIPTSDQYDYTGITTTFKLKKLDDLPNALKEHISGLSTGMLIELVSGRATVSLRFVKDKLEINTDAGYAISRSTH